jgi:hypothetical protein
MPAAANHLLHPPETRHAAPRPKQRLHLPAPLRFPDAVHQVERVQQVGGHRHGAENALAALLQVFEHHHAARQVDLPGGEGHGERRTARTARA